MKTRTWITGIVSMVVNAVLFGIGAVTVLSVPSLNDHATVLLPVVIVASLIAAPPIAWSLAPRLRLRPWRD